jgi:hypothetical protein
MNAHIKKIFEAHVKHELNHFKKGGYKQSIDEEISAAFDWIRKVKFKDIVPLDQMLGLIQRNVVEMPIAGGITELSGEMSRLVHASKKNKTTKLEKIFLRRQFDEIIDKVVSLKTARNEVIHSFLNSPFYSKLISHVLYTGIIEYLITENIIAQNVPGLSSLIKMGKNAVNLTLPGLEPMFEKQIRRFIENNMKTSILKSERFVKELLVENQIIEMGDDAWDVISKKSLSEYFSLINGDDMEDFILIGYDFWRHFRKTSYFKKIYTEIVHHFYNKYGNEDLDIFIEDVGVTKEMLVRELTEIVSHGVEKAIAIGYVEERIRARLLSFYNSKAAARIIK